MDKKPSPEMSSQAAPVGDSGPAPAPRLEQVREQTIHVHIELKRLMREVHGLYRRVDWGELDAAPVLHDQLRKLVAEVERQVALEQALLAPVLATLDAWGALREGQLREVHDREQSAIRQVDREASPDDAARLAVAARYLVAEVLREIRWEEQHLLDPDLFSDDAIIHNQLDG
jgi:hypothetical protein